MSQQVMHDVAVEGAKVTPPALVTGAMFFGMTPNELVAVATLVYLALQIGLLFFKYRDEFRRWRQERKVKREAAVCEPAEGGSDGK